MALIALSAALSVILGSCIWLAVGERLPFGESDKWPVATNILCYAAVCVLPVYLLIFFIF